jgi:nitric oxide reductase subunit B
MATNDVADQLRAQGVTDPRDRVVTEFRTNRYNPDTKTLVFTDRQAAAFNRIQNHYAAYFGENSTKYGLLPKMITDKSQIRDLTGFFAWTAWAAAAEFGFLAGKEVQCIAEVAFGWLGEPRL